MLKNKSFLLSIVSVGIPLLFQLFYVRFVSYEVDKQIYGNFILLSALIYGLSQILLSIPGQAFSRFYNTHNDKNYFINEFRTYLLAVNTLSIFAIGIIYFFYKDRFSTEIYILLYILFALFNNYTFNQKIFLLSLEREKYLILKVFEGAAKFLFPLFIYFFYKTLESFLAGIVLGYIVSFLILVKYLKHIPFQFSFNIKNQIKYFLFAYPILISSIFSWGMSFSDRFFIDIFLTPKDVAIYSLLAQFSAFGQVLATIYGIYVNPIILNKFEKNHEEGVLLLRYYLKKFFIVLIGTFCIILLIPIDVLSIFLQKEIISDDYLYATFLLLTLGVLLTVFQTAMSLYFVLYKKLHIHATIFGIAAVINFGLNFFIADYGIIMAAIATLIAYTILNVLIILWIKNFEQKSVVSPYAI